MGALFFRVPVQAVMSAKPSGALVVPAARLFSSAAEEPKDPFVVSVVKDTVNTMESILAKSKSIPTPFFSDDEKEINEYAAAMKKLRAEAGLMSDVERYGQRIKACVAETEDVNEMLEKIVSIREEFGLPGRGGSMKLLFEMAEETAAKYGTAMDFPDEATKKSYLESKGVDVEAVYNDTKLKALENEAEMATLKASLEESRQNILDNLEGMKRRDNIDVDLEKDINLREL